jgi:hypothetical protein
MQLAIALVRAGEIDAVVSHTGHLIPARNLCWRDAVTIGAVRVLWLDADVYAPHAELVEYMRDADRVMSAPQSATAWIGAVVARRGAGWAMRASQDALRYPLLLGLGIAYWDVPRMRVALGDELEHSFRWLPPLGEDFDACARTWDAGYFVAVDPLLPTTHDGVGSWEGSTRVPEENDR